MESGYILERICQKCSSAMSTLVWEDKSDLTRYEIRAKRGEISYRRERKKKLEREKLGKIEKREESKREEEKKKRNYKSLSHNFIPSKLSVSDLFSFRVIGGALQHLESVFSINPKQKLESEP